MIRITPTLLMTFLVAFPPDGHPTVLAQDVESAQITARSTPRKPTGNPPKAGQPIGLPAEQPADNAAIEKRKLELAARKASRTAAADAARAQEQALQLRSLADMIGGAIQDAFNPEPKVIRRAAPVPARIPQVNVVQRNANPQPAEIERRLGRLQAYSRVTQDWVASVCGLSDEQTAKLAANCRQNVEMSQNNWLQKPRRARSSLSFGDTFPINFTLQPGAADDIDLVRFSKPVTSLQSLLTVEQKEAFNAAVAERRQFQVDCMIDQIINIMDAELFLTMKQREHFQKTLPSRVKGLQGQSLSLSPYTDYYRQSSIASLMQSGDHLNVLTDIQQARAQEFSATDRNDVQNINQQHLRFRSSESAEQWQNRLKQGAAIQRDRVYLACAVRANYHRAADNLSDTQTRHLMVAARGVAEDIVRAWKKQTQKAFNAAAQRVAAGGQIRGDFLFLVRVVDLALIDQNSIWRHTLAKFTDRTGHAVRVRGEARRKADAATIVGFLDRELWLHPDQRSQLANLVWECVPENGVTFNQSTIHLVDVALILLPLSRMSQQDVSMLTPTQQDVWKTLKAHFHFTERTAQVLNLANGRSLSIEISR
ncbi:MAG: hypothetical protein GY903_16805 [Fuerstiella sp.]|nr:hypothetical protein [Fuerstiella sp.]MCP4856144.1 hypothetical protein [Fuerstiella sp.]